MEGTYIITKSSGKNSENNFENSTDFKIKSSEKLFMLLSDGVYSDKISAPIRELISNAFDIHQELNVDKPFVVKLPTEEDRLFEVRDYGSGLTDDEIREVYTVYGESTRENSNAYTGAYGLGSKSPFAYTDAFLVNSYKDGVVSYYSMFIEDGLPKCSLIGRGETAEPDGLCVTMTIKKADCLNFHTTGEEILKFFPQGSCLVKNQFGFFDIYHKNWEQAPGLPDGYELNNFEFKLSNMDELDSGIVQSNVCYKISSEELSNCVSKFLNSSKSTKYSCYKQDKIFMNFCGYLKVPNGTVFPHPSRERLSFDQATSDNIGAAIVCLWDELVEKKLKDLYNCSGNSYVRLYLNSTKEKYIIRNTYRRKEIKFDGSTLSYDQFLRKTVCDVGKVSISDRGTVNLRFSTFSSVTDLLKNRRTVFYKKPNPETNKITLSQRERMAILNYCHDGDADAALNSYREVYIVPDTLESPFNDIEKSNFVAVDSLKKAPKSFVEDFYGRKGTEKKYYVMFRSYQTYSTKKETVDDIIDRNRSNWSMVLRISDSEKPIFEHNGVHYDMKTVADRTHLGPYFDYFKTVISEYYNENLYFVFCSPEDKNFGSYKSAEDLFNECMDKYVHKLNSTNFKTYSHDYDFFRNTIFAEWATTNEKLKPYFPSETLEKYGILNKQGYDTVERTYSPTVEKVKLLFELNNPTTEKLVEQYMKKATSDYYKVNIDSEIIYVLAKEFPLVLAFLKAGDTNCKRILSEIKVYVEQKLKMQ